MAHVTLPKTSQTGVNEWADVEDNDVALRDALNGGLDNTNVSASAALALSKLAAGTSAQIIVCNGSGVPVYVAMSGDATVATTGAVTIAASAVDTAELAAGAVETAKIEDANVTDAKLASPNNSAYKTVHHVSGYLANDQAAGTFFVGGKSRASPLSIGTGGVVEEAAPIFYLDDADYTVASKTTKLRIRAQVACNATAPGTMTFIFGLYPVTTSGAADTLTYTLGTVVAGSTATVTDPSGSPPTSAVGSDVTIPADGNYALGVVTNATIANNSAVGIHAQLQLRHT